MKYSYIIIAFLFLSACKETPQITEASTATLENDLPEWARDATIYEVNMRQFTKEGTFEAFSTHIPRIKDMGIEILWFMPLHPISKIKRKGSLGSPYAVADYKKINPEYGTMEDFDAMVQKIHEAGLKIIIDWVPNHTGWDNVWITEHPEWYTKNDEGEIIDPIDYNTGESWGWTDVADLNYDSQEMRQEMINSMLFWIRDRNIDGFRMDVAHGVPDDFWQLCNETLKKEGDIFLLAEGEVPKQRNKGGFHADYGWSFHHLMNEIAHGKKDVNDIWKYISEDRSKFNKGFHMNFTSNHDENTWAGSVFERMGESHKAMAVMAATIGGMPLIYGGQEEPLKKRLEFFEKDEIGFNNYEYQDFYTTLMNLKKSNESLWNGPYGAPAETILQDKNVIGFQRDNGKNKVSVYINLSDKQQEVTTEHKLVPSKVKIQSEQKVSIEDGKLTLPPWAYIVQAE